MKFFKKFELDLESEARHQKLELSSKLELLGTLWTLWQCRSEQARTVLNNMQAAKDKATD